MTTKIQNALELHKTQHELKDFENTYTHACETIHELMTNEPANKIGHYITESLNDIDSRFNRAINKWLLSHGKTYMSASEIQDDPIIQSIKSDMVITFSNVSLRQVTIPADELKHRGVWVDI